MQTAFATVKGFCSGAAENLSFSVLTLHQ